LEWYHPLEPPQVACFEYIPIRASGWTSEVPSSLSNSTFGWLLCFIVVMLFISVCFLQIVYSCSWAPPNTHIPTPTELYEHHRRHHDLIVVYLFPTIHDNVGREVMMERDHLSCISGKNNKNNVVTSIFSWLIPYHN
jgi:hypothetical protein